VLTEEEIRIVKESNPEMRNKGERSENGRSMSELQSSMGNEE
jgi:hypothetical protein